MRKTTTLALAAILAASCDAESPRTADPASAAKHETDIPVLDVDLGDFFIEIDDRNLDGAGNRDANLCSDAANATGGSVLAQPSGAGTACPNPLPFEGSLATDNPNYPGPDSNLPETLGADESLYVDWAALNAAVHITPFEDLSPTGQDDILSPGACYKADGSSPPKANFDLTGFAANDEYLYILQEREKHQGNEEYHFFFTSRAPKLLTPDDVDTGAVPGLPSVTCDTWVWDLRDGDVEVIISYPSTAGLPQAQVFVSTWTGGDQDNLDGEDLVASTDWTLATGSNLAFVALNIAPDNKAEPTEDVEHDFDGTALSSGLKTEVAINLDAVFGSGCGLNQFVAGISTASQGPNDDLKDFLSPKNLQTGDIDASLDLVGSCETSGTQNFERFDYDVTVLLDDLSEVTLPDDDIDVFIDFDCDGVTGTVQDDDGEGCVGPELECTGALPTTVTFPASCEITARVEGTGGDFDPSCTDEDVQTTTLFEELSALLGAGAADICPVSAADILDAFPFNLQITGGSGEYSVAWGATGDAENNTCATTTDITETDADFSTNCEFDLDPTLSCAEGSVTATVTDDLCGTVDGPLAVAASRQIERLVQTGCAADADCALGEVCDNGFCEPSP